MARCKYLGYELRAPLASQGDYYCDLHKKTLSESEVSKKCNAAHCDDYEQCPIYKNR